MKVENGAGQWALEGVKLAWFIMTPMCAGQWQENGNPRSYKGPGYFSVNIYGSLPQDVGFHKAILLTPHPIHPSSGCGKQKVQVYMGSSNGLLWG